ncbi:MAG: hypothetical protein EZS28_026423 [Streblomastix strix]|uniref:Uncharacterized protein n=1 Tax=Streblomastix strix TaxID=222440 RepID=A0A5J4V779_9EUKA|nr:MAG: hypothetical protein EZS28_026423 [Streblomastix strix]
MRQQTKKSSPSLVQVIHNPEGYEYSSERNVSSSLDHIQQIVTSTSADKQWTDEEFTQIMQEAVLGQTPPQADE